MFAPRWLIAGLSERCVHQADRTGWTTPEVIDGSTFTAQTPTTTAPAGRTVGRKRYVDLTWSGATTSQVEVYRNDALRTTTANDGTHTDNLNRQTGTFRYRVTHPGGAPTSDEATVTF